jgi:hypothetical protein
MKRYLELINNQSLIVSQSLKLGTSVSLKDSPNNIVFNLYKSELSKLESISYQILWNSTSNSSNNFELGINPSTNLNDVNFILNSYEFLVNDSLNYVSTLPSNITTSTSEVKLASNYQSVL